MRSNSKSEETMKVADFFLTERIPDHAGLMGVWSHFMTAGLK